VIIICTPRCSPRNCSVQNRLTKSFADEWPTRISVADILTFVYEAISVEIRYPSTKLRFVLFGFSDVIRIRTSAILIRKCIQADIMEKVIRIVSLIKSKSKLDFESLRRPIQQLCSKILWGHALLEDKQAKFFAYRFPRLQSRRSA